MSRCASPPDSVSWPSAGRIVPALGAAALLTGALILAGCAPAEQTPTLTWYTNPDDGGQAKIAAQCTDAANGQYRIENVVLGENGVWNFDFEVQIGENMHESISLAFEVEDFR